MLFGAICPAGKPQLVRKWGGAGAGWMAAPNTSVARSWSRRCEGQRPAQYGVGSRVLLSTRRGAGASPQANTR